MIIHENFSLKKHNTFGIDAKAKYFAEVSDVPTLHEILNTPQFKNIPKLILGGGSNILFTKDYDGLVMNLSMKGINVVEENNNQVIIEASAGEVWDDFVSYCVSNKYYGVENLSLIPGSIGAAPVQNIGAYGVELQDMFVSLTGIMFDTCEEKTLSKSECKFGYRDSIFKNELKEKFVVTSVKLRLSKEKKFNLNYRAFQDFIKPELKDKLTIRDVRTLVKEIRKSKLPDPSKIGNAGSFFKNPEVNLEKLKQLQKIFPDIVHFLVEENKYKIPAGWLIEKCGFKGKRIGNAGTYRKQALVIINYGNATGEEIINFATRIQDAVLEKFGIKIIPEVNVI